MTEVINKHLVRVHDKPMAQYPLEKMIETGIKDILIVTGGDNFAAVVKYFGSGHKWNININYAIQDQPGGIAQALGLARQFVGEDSVLVCLGDNLWNMNIRQAVESFACGATLFSIQSKTPERFGVLKYSGEELLDVIEKPDIAPSNWVLAGLYIYGPGVFSIIDSLKPSDRGELEITDVNRWYIQSGLARIIKMDGWWSDCGTMETLLQTEELIKNDRPVSALRA